MISLQPSLLVVGGELPMEKTWIGKVTLQNPSSAIAEVEFCQELMTISTNSGPGDVGGLDALLSPSGNNPDTGHDEGIEFLELPEGSHVRSSDNNSNTELVRLNKLQIELDPPRILLMPSSEAQVTVHVTAFCLGDYNINIPMRGANGGNSAVDSLNIAVKTCGPKLRFLEPEIDLGLAGVGTCVSQKFTMTNDGTTPAAFRFNVLTEAEMLSATEDAQGYNEDGSRKENALGSLENGANIASVPSADSEEGGFGDASNALGVASSIEVGPETNEGSPGNQSGV